MKADNDFGHIEFMIEDAIKISGLTKSKVAFMAELQRTQLNAYLKGTVSRIDLAVLSRLCHALNCGISDIMRYVPPKLDALDKQYDRKERDDRDDREKQDKQDKQNNRDGRAVVAEISAREAMLLVAEKTEDISSVFDGLHEDGGSE